ncbi:hypothetical protein NSE01_23960 [Novosphingobium sediminis]|uniref:Uncharacterized protein n=1 Tax=Novosphingobium sediminis TaxID=707214 RepID=A0A512ALL7_9SPHN|nr:hypothetical protein [Novosphingobium sediminis]GEO00564.1 hypothetical protein NSE01_23960 [Novosphingobium sediminis]
MDGKTFLTTFATLENDDGYPIEFAAFAITGDGDHDYRFSLSMGGLRKFSGYDLPWRYLDHVAEGGDILCVMPLQGQSPLAATIDIGALASAFRMLGLPIEGYGRMHVLRTSDWQIVQTALDCGLPYRGHNRKLDIESQIALLPLRAQAIWLTWLSETRDVLPVDKRAVLAAWQAWWALERLRSGTTTI